MKKSRLIGAVCAVLFTFVSVPINAEDGVVYDADKYGSQDMLGYSIATETNQAKRNRNDSPASGLMDVFIISCGLIGFVLLRKAHNMKMELRGKRVKTTPHKLSEH
jgi:hypothetical protein